MIDYILLGAEVLFLRNSSDTLMICNGAPAPLQIMRVSE